VLAVRRPRLDYCSEGVLDSLAARVGIQGLPRGEEFKAVVRPKRFIRFVLIYINTNSLILSIPLFSHVPQVVGTFNDGTAKPEGFVWQIGTQKIDTCFRQSKGF
jgi:hypothetical protein